MKHIVTHTDARPALIRMDDMPAGSVGVIEQSPIGRYLGRVVMRVVGTDYVVALDSGGVWSSMTGVRNHLVRLLPPGTKITIEVGA